MQALWGGWEVLLVSLVLFLGVLAKKEPEKQSMATAGFVCSIIGTIFMSVYVCCMYRMCGWTCKSGIIAEALLRNFVGMRRHSPFNS